MTKSGKKISTKMLIAIILLIIGVVLLVVGIIYPNFLSEEGSSNNNGAENGSGDELVCTYEQNRNADGTDLTSTLNLTFEDNKLVSYTKNIAAHPTTGNEETGTATLQNTYNTLEPLQKVQIAGYSMLAMYDGMFLQSNITVDFPNLDKEATKDYNTIYMKVDFEYNDSYNDAKSKAEQEGYQCK